ncbi:hypothetical protein VNI00_017676 [Paramarasmius palmivorus]|uniref:Uncharacterized protein n=1 Tax=Paramarasmius palmivorus TaxID=297713 RepID=A0AAW0B3P9_9AGAR
MLDSLKRTSSLSSLSSVGSDLEDVSRKGSGQAVQKGVVSSALTVGTTSEPSAVIELVIRRVPSTPEKRRRGSDEDSLSPSKIRVKDLTLSPRKAVQDSSRDIADGRSGVKRRAAGSKSKSKGGVGSVLLARLDALADGDDDQSLLDIGVSDDAYAPAARVRQKKSLARSKSGKEVKISDVEVVPDSDTSMHSPTVSRAPSPIPNIVGKGKGKGKGVERVPDRADSDSEDTLPSPTSVFASRTKVPFSTASSGQFFVPLLLCWWLLMELYFLRAFIVGAAEQGRLSKTVSGEKSGPGPGRRKGEVRISSPVWDIEDMDVDGSAANDVEERPTGRRLVVGTKKSAVSAHALTASGSSASANALAPAVFSSALSLPEDDDETDLEEDVQPTGSFLLDTECIHPTLLELYKSLPWINGLKRAKFIGYLNTEGIFGDFTPVSYARLLDAVDPRVMSKLARSIGFVQYKDFKSPVRLPLMGFSRNWECVRLPRVEGSRSAAFVLTGVSTSSHLSVGREVGQSFVKQLHVRPLENDWLILQCNIGTFLNDDEMHAPGRNNALIFQTKRQGWTARSADREQDPLGSTPYTPSGLQSSSSAVAASSVSNEEEAGDVATVNILHKGAPPYRTFDEGVPVYDGRTKPGVKGFRFGPGDWDSYTELPAYPLAEVENQSLVTIVFTLSGFRIGNAAHYTVHFNALFAIVLGKVKL